MGIHDALISFNPLTIMENYTQIIKLIREFKAEHEGEIHTLKEFEQYVRDLDDEACELEEENRKDNQYKNDVDSLLGK